MVVVNSSPIIALGKLERLDFLRKLFEKVHITEQVYEEVALKQSSEEAIALKKAVYEDKWVAVRKSGLINEILDIGEASSVFLASKLKEPLLIDDKKAVSTADALDIECHGTLYIILLALKKGIIKNKKEAVEIVNKLMENRLYLSGEVLMEFYSLLGRIKMP